VTNSAPIPTLIATDIKMTYETYLDPKRSLRSIARSGPAATRRRSVEVHAVKSVTFTLHERETLGIVGHTGAGKSSLLLGLAGLIELTIGHDSCSIAPDPTQRGGDPEPATVRPAKPRTRLSRSRHVSR
jgi:ABC-type polysaccharide/polyol phosphate transport system ATPase subunit